MTRIVLIFGLISGGILSVMMAIMVPACMNGNVDFEQSEVVGYTSMVLAFLMVFFGIRTYRENVNGGAIGFGRAFKVGIFITLVTCAMYVVAWQIIYYNFVPDFLDKYTAHVIEKMQKDGEPQLAIEVAKEKMAKMNKFYAHPLGNILITFGEVFPVGLIMTLVSAGILRKKNTPAAPSAAAAMAG